MDKFPEPSRFRGLKYFPKSGVIYRNNLVQGPSKVGKIGTLKHRGYLEFTYRCKKYRSARAAMEIFHNRKLSSIECVDHINGNKSDNRACNLRVVTQRENCRNQPIHRSGKRPGYTFHKKTGKYMSQVKAGGKNIYLGLFNTADEAINVHMKYLEKMGNVE